VYVADTYNHKIKKLNPQTRELSTFIGTGKRGMTDGPAASAQLNEPAGLCFAEGKMFIADANNHVIRICELKSGIVSPMQWKNLEKLAPKKEPTSTPREGIVLKAETISTTAKSLDFKLELPKGKKLNPLAPSRIKATIDDVEVIEFPAPEQPLKADVVSL